jgi:hypothetical protein
MISLDEARTIIIDKLSELGIRQDYQRGVLIADDNRLVQKKLAALTNKGGTRYAGEVAQYFANPDEIDISKINPDIRIVNSKQTERLWAFALSNWSIPVTAGFGRRLRFLIFDRQNEKLIGLIGLSDPVVGLGIRESLIGWNREQRLERLYNCMTAYILGAVPPYNAVLGGKLVALLAASPDIRNWVYHKYLGKETIISKKNKEPHLVYLDTMGAFGKSAVYNRLKFWYFGGYTKGHTHIHLTANGSWEIIKQFIPDEEFRKYEYGQGPSWKIRVLKIGLKNLGFSESMMSIGWQRGYYYLPLANNWQEYLRGETDKIEWKSIDTLELVLYWKERWVLPRLENLMENLEKIKKEQSQAG